MNARRLLAWSDLEAGRRRRAARGVARLPAAVRGGALGGLLALEIARRTAAGDWGSASQLWLAVAIAAAALATFGAPFRMYWRADSALLAQLPIPGTVLYHLALRRGARAAAVAALPCAVGALGFAAVGEIDLALRHAATMAVAAAAAAAIGPAAALFAEALIASDRAMAAMQSLTAEASAPPTTWLGMFPGIAAAAIGVALMAAAPWLAGDAQTVIGPVPVWLAVVLGTAVVALIGSLPLAPVAMVAAVREVAALDRERLAHVELTQPSALERAWSRLVRREGRDVYLKDARLARRRYPAPYFLTALAIAALWGVAIIGPEAYVAWFGWLVAGLAAYAVIMARRSVQPPIEYPRLLATLALTPAAIADAKRKPVLLRVVVGIGLGAGPAVAFAPDPGEVAPLAVVAAVAALTLGRTVARRG